MTGRVVVTVVPTDEVNKKSGAYLITLSTEEVDELFEWLDEKGNRKCD